MGPEVLIVALIFGTIFGIFYLFISSRNKERLALIEKGAEANIFVKGRSGNAPIWKVIILNFSLLLMGVGLGIFIASILDYSLGVDAEVAYPGTIFLMAGVGLFTGFKMTSDLDKKD